MKEPENYSESSIEKISNKYQKVANNINAERKMNVSDQTVIFNLSESFIDPYMAPGVKIKGHDPIPFIRSMQNRSTYGKMLSTGYGGDTANMEFQGLTGFTLGLMSIPTLVAYTQVVPYHPFFPTIGMNFKYKSAIHPFDGTFYSRIEDYQRFSFNKFAYFGSKYKIYDQKKIDDNPNDSDFTLYYNALHQIDSRKGGQFISLLSIQNHMPYNNWYKHNEYKGKVFGKYLDNDEVRTSFATYVKGTEYTDKAVKKFINHIDNIDKPITIVFYGDHYPGILNSDLIYKYPIRLHSTRYFIYSNKYAREHGAKTKLDTNYNYVNTSEFIPMMLEQTDSKVTAYQALLTEVHKKLPAITINYDGGKGFELIDHETGKKVDQKTLTPEQKELLHDYELVQYDMNVGKSYALKNTNFYGKLK
ncbi:MAG: LTA synthase family protein [Limosilactobacillus sp.]|uniref:LTA synthase family protein n=1 Tax=Limosilactobacillus sp. TaxID=2773925 RepID=UPI0027012CC7|nr:LTA synthase family protein [Limosilactobacillus sp.]